MKAGKTELEVGTKVRITGISGGDGYDQRLVGLVGEITHPFPGLMNGPTSDYVAGLFLDDEEVAKAHGLSLGKFGVAKVNICCNDSFEVVEPELEYEPLSPRM